MNADKKTQYRLLQGIENPITIQRVDGHLEHSEWLESVAWYTFKNITEESR